MPRVLLTLAAVGFVWGPARAQDVVPGPARPPEHVEKAAKEARALVDRAKKGGPDSPVRKLQVEKADLALTVFDDSAHRVAIGKMSVGEVLHDLLQVQRAHLDLTADPADLAAMARVCLELAKQCEQEAEALQKAALATKGLVAQVRIVRLDLEIQVLTLSERARKGAKK